MRILAIDPGSTESAFLLYDPELRVMADWAKVPNDVLLRYCDTRFPGYCPEAELLAIEMIASYGMPVGREVFDTCVLIGRVAERWEIRTGRPVRLVYRREVKMHLTGSNRSKDPHVRQALLDKFGPGKDLAVGKKATPGPLYGLSGDGWAALGVAVTAAETTEVSA